MSGMGFMNAAQTSELVGAFGVGTSRVAFEMGTDGVAYSIPGLGQTAIKPAGMDGSTLSGLDM